MATTEQRPILSPQLIGPAEYNAALDDLRATGEGAFVDFIAAASANELMVQALGPTPSCLSVEDISDLLKPGVPSFAASEYLGERGRSQEHLAKCLNCRSNVESYEQLLGDSQSDLFLESLQVSQRLRVLATEPLEVTYPFRPQELDITLLDIGEESASPIDILPGSLQVKGAVVAHVRQVRHVPNAHVRVLRGRQAIVCEVDVTNVPALTRRAAKLPFCDWIEISGRTAKGESFARRALIPFAPVA